MKRTYQGILILSLLAGCQSAQVVGTKPNILPNGQKLQSPGQRLEMPGRPVDMLLTADQQHIVIKDFNAIRVVDSATNALLGSETIPGGASLTGIAENPITKEIWVTNAQTSIQVFSIKNPAKPERVREIPLPKSVKNQNSFPCGITFTSDGSRAIIAQSINNQVVCLDTETDKPLWTSNVGIAPYAVAIHKGKIIVSEQGGPITKPGAKTAPSAGTETEVDDRGIAAKGSVSILDLSTGKSLAQVVTGLQPGAIAINPTTETAYVAEANNDSITLIDLKTNKKSGEFESKPDPRLPFGSMPNALAIDSKSNRIYVANAGNNAIAIFDLKSKKLLGQIPTDWNPSGVILNNNHLYILNNKGVGARPINNQEKPAYNSHEKNGTLIKLTLDDKKLPEYSKLAAQITNQSRMLADQMRTGSNKTKPVPIPKKLGDPSVIKHVIYVIKENRTYDQFFGSLPKGNGEPKLNTFNDDHIPNQRALAQQFVQLDNYYCNGVLSADGHSWATEGNLTPYLNRAFGGFTRSYTFGDDPITYSSSGFIWDGILAAGLSFRNYGEFNYSEPEPKMSGKEIFEKYRNGEPLKFSQNIGVANVRRYSNPNSPGWNMNIPDQLRMDVFLQDFREFEKSGDLPNFMTIYLPQDHTGGPVTPAAHMADNDLAVGRLVDAVSKSKFWKDTVIFINEDDPQAGTDHVDGHRSICLVVSPYTRNRGLVSDFYNQVSVLKTINRIFAIAPMNQNDGAATLMDNCFKLTADTSPFTAITPKQSLYEYNSTETLNATALAYLKQVQKIDLTEREVQSEPEMDALSRFVWHAQMGSKPYPTEWAGPHGRGLKSLGLSLGKTGGIDWDD
jgi:DNA-binding beta-propeller fold protein YncE